MPLGTQRAILHAIGRIQYRIGERAAITYDMIALECGISPCTVWRNLKPLLAAQHVTRETVPLAGSSGWGFRYELPAGYRVNATTD